MRENKVTITEKRAIMEYNGDLYGKVGGMVFKTGKTSKDWDKMEARLKELEVENLALKQANDVKTENEPGINYDGLLGTVPDSLFGNECRNHKCVYNVAATCKNRDIGKACKGHCA